MATTDENLNDINRLVALSGSDFEIADGQPNIKGWDVFDIQHKKIGDVDELLFNPASRRVRYVVIDLKDNAFNLTSRHIAVPIGLAELHEHNSEVLLPQVTAVHLTSLPTYEKGKQLTQDRELAIRNAFAVAKPEVLQGADFYEHEHFNENRFYNKNEAAQQHTINPDHQLPETGSTDSVETNAQKQNRDNILP